MEFKLKIRFPILAVGIFTLLVGIWVGLQRMGWQFPGFEGKLMLLHGPLMIAGFLGTVIGMERAVAQNKLWQYLAPFFNGLGALLTIIGVERGLAAILFTFGSLVLLIINFELLRKHPSMHMGIMFFGAVSFLVGNILWLFNVPIFHIAMWWSSFLVLTIMGERLELSRILQMTKGIKNFFISGNIIYFIGIIVATFNFPIGMKITGIAMLLLSYWLLRYDLARRSVKQPGLPKFIAQSLIIGYVWLAIGGVLSVFFGEAPAGFYYDAILHSILLGFVFSMIFGHAPLIFPAILNVNMNFGKRFYIHLYMLHITLLLRVVSDIFFWNSGRLWGGILNGVSILLFFVMTVTSIRKKP